MLFKRSMPYSVQIQPTDNAGYLVEVGCQRRVYTDAEAMIADLRQYLAMPDDVLEQYKNAVHCGDIGQRDLGPIGYEPRGAAVPMTATEVAMRGQAGRDSI